MDRNATSEEGRTFEDHQFVRPDDNTKIPSQSPSLPASSLTGSFPYIPEDSCDSILSYDDQDDDDDDDSVELPSRPQSASSSSQVGRGYQGMLSGRSTKTQEPSAVEELQALMQSVREESSNSTDKIENVPDAGSEENETSSMEVDYQRSAVPNLEMVEQPEESYRARYESEGCRGPIRGISENGFPTVKVNGYTGNVVMTVFLVTDNGEPHLHSITGPGSTKTTCKEVKLKDNITGIQTWIGPDQNMTAVWDSLSVLRIRNWDADKKLRERGEDPAAWKNKKKEARLMFQCTVPQAANRPGYILTCQSRPFRCTAPSGNPEIWWMSTKESLAKGGKEAAIVGKKFAAGYRVRFYNSDSEGVWEALADIDRSKSHQGAIVFKVPAYKTASIEKSVGVSVEVRVGPEKDKRCSESVSFQYVPDDDGDQTATKSCAQCNSIKTALSHLFEKDSTIIKPEPDVTDEGANSNKQSSHVETTEARRRVSVDAMVDDNSNSSSINDIATRERQQQMDEQARIVEQIRRLQSLRNVPVSDVSKPITRPLSFEGREEGSGKKLKTSFGDFIHMSNAPAASQGSSFSAEAAASQAAVILQNQQQQQQTQQQTSASILSSVASQATDLLQRLAMANSINSSINNSHAITVNQPTSGVNTNANTGGGQINLQQLPNIAFLPANISNTSQQQQQPIGLCYVDNQQQQHIIRAYAPVPSLIQHSIQQLQQQQVQPQQTVLSSSIASQHHSPVLQQQQTSFLPTIPTQQQQQHQPQQQFVHQSFQPQSTQFVQQSSQIQPTNRFAAVIGAIPSMSSQIGTSKAAEFVVFSSGLSGAPAVSSAVLDQHIKQEPNGIKPSCAIAQTSSVTPQINDVWSFGSHVAASQPVQVFSNTMPIQQSATNPSLNKDVIWSLAPGSQTLYQIPAQIPTLSTSVQQSTGFLPSSSAVSQFIAQSQAVQAAQSVQQQTQGTTQPGQGVPQQAQALPQQVQVIPQQTQSVPQQAGVMPQQGQVMPQQPQTMSQQVQTVQQQVQAVQQQVQAAQQQAQAISQQTSPALQQAQALPQQTHPIPQPTQSMPRQAETPPQQNQAVPANMGSNSMVSNNMVSNNMVSNSMGSNSMVSNSMVSNNMVSSMVSNMVSNIPNVYSATNNMTSVNNYLNMALALSNVNVSAVGTSPTDNFISSSHMVSPSSNTIVSLGSQSAVVFPMDKPANSSQDIGSVSDATKVSESNTFNVVNYQPVNQSATYQFTTQLPASSMENNMQIEPTEGWSAATGHMQNTASSNAAQNLDEPEKHLSSGLAQDLNRLSVVGSQLQPNSMQSEPISIPSNNNQQAEQSEQRASAFCQPQPMSLTEDPIPADLINNRLMKEQSGQLDMPAEFHSRDATTADSKFIQDAIQSSRQFDNKQQQQASVLLVSEQQKLADSFLVSPQKDCGVQANELHSIEQIASQVKPTRDENMIDQYINQYDQMKSLAEHSNIAMLNSDFTAANQVIDQIRSPDQSFSGNSNTYQQSFTTGAVDSSVLGGMQNASNTMDVNAMNSQSVAAMQANSGATGWSQQGAGRVGNRSFDTAEAGSGWISNPSSNASSEQSKIEPSPDSGFSPASKEAQMGTIFISEQGHSMDITESLHQHMQNISQQQQQGSNQQQQQQQMSANISQSQFQGSSFQDIPPHQHQQQQQQQQQQFQANVNSVPGYSFQSQSPVTDFQNLQQQQPPNAQHATVMQPSFQQTSTEGGFQNIYQTDTSPNNQQQEQNFAQVDQQQSTGPSNDETSCVNTSQTVVDSAAMYSQQVNNVSTEERQTFDIIPFTPAQARQSEWNELVEDTKKFLTEGLLNQKEGQIIVSCVQQEDNLLLEMYRTSKMGSEDSKTKVIETLKHWVLNVKHVTTVIGPNFAPYWPRLKSALISTIRRIGAMAHDICLAMPDWLINAPIQSFHASYDVGC
eukprot:gene7472-8301_t